MSLTYVTSLVASIDYESDINNNGSMEQLINSSDDIRGTDMLIKSRYIDLQTHTSTQIGDDSNQPTGQLYQVMFV